MMNKKALVSGSLLLSLSSAAIAHDFWLEPGHYYYDDASEVPIQFKVGHKEDADNWNLRWDKIVALRNYTPSGVVDMAASIIPKTNLLPGVAKSKKLQPGTYVIGFESYHSVSQLDSDKFNSYVEEEGLEEIKQYRESKGLMNTSGSELYSRKAKTIVQIGNEQTPNATASIGHTLEIVPKIHPYDLDEKGRLPVTVLFKGQPLENAMVEATPLEGAAHNVQTLRTNSKGNATFLFPNSGPVILNTVWGVPLRNNSKADFETYFSSITFTVSHSNR